MNDTGTNTRLIGTDLAFLSGGGELGSRIREHDWASTPLGPPQICAAGVQGFKEAGP